MEHNKISWIICTSLLVILFCLDWSWISTIFNYVGYFIVLILIILLIFCKISSPLFKHIEREIGNVFKDNPILLLFSLLFPIKFLVTAVVLTGVTMGILLIAIFIGSLVIFLIGTVLRGLSLDQVGLPLIGGFLNKTGEGFVVSSTIFVVICALLIFIFNVKKSQTNMKNLFNSSCNFYYILLRLITSIENTIFLRTIDFM